MGRSTSKCVGLEALMSKNSELVRTPVHEQLSISKEAEA